MGWGWVERELGRQSGASRTHLKQCSGSEAEASGEREERLLVTTKYTNYPRRDIRSVAVSLGYCADVIHPLKL